MKIKKSLHVGEVSTIGPDKQFNEDYMECSSGTIETPDDVHILIMADGMGGHTFGDVASFYAVNFMMKWWRGKVRMHETLSAFFKDCQNNVEDAFQKINERLIKVGKLEESNIGTTMSVLMVVGDQYLICHVGDSRIYRFNDSRGNESKPMDETIDLNKNKTFVQLTKDDSWATMQVENGLMTMEEAVSHSKAHLLTQCVGIKGSVAPFTASGKLTENDHFLLCTDGLYSLFTDGVLEEQWKYKMAHQASLQDIADHFYALAKTANHYDDVSILIANFS